MSYLSSRGSEDSTSALSGQDSAPSPSLSERPRANTGLASTGRESQSMTMFAPFQGFLFEDLSISSVEDSPASRSASPGSRKGPKTNGTFGPRCHESSAKSDPVGYSLRMFLACELSRLTSSSKTWKDRGTPAGRSWWVLMTSEGRTGESAFGSSRENWITPTQEDANKPFGDGPKAIAGRGATSSQRLRNQFHWPTATAGDAKASGSAGYSTASGRHSGTTLTDATTRQWPTPRAEDSEQTGGHRGAADTLTAAGRLWASPQARDWKDSGPQCAGLLAPESPSTHGKPQDWPTPRTTDATGGPDTVRPDEMRKQGTGPDLKAVVNQEWPTPRANRHGAPDSHGKSPIRGSLNPRWVAQLMGFPADWLDSPPPTAAKPSRRSAMRSALGTHTSSGGQS